MVSIRRESAARIREGQSQGNTGADDNGLSTFMDAMIVDTVVVAKRIDIKDFL